MPVSISRLRIWFAVLALAAVVVVAGYYLRARIEMHLALKNLPGKLGIEIQQTSEGFSLSKSEGGHTLYTIRASKATQFKAGGRAELHDVSIVVYGRNSERFDQIYGQDFEYDQQAGSVVSKGEVFIDLQGNSEGLKLADQATPHETQNPIHLRTVGMVFNQKTGLAETEGEVEFRVPQASGTAHGASYDTKKNELTLRSEINIETSGSEPAHIQAVRGTITKEPRVMTLEAAQMASKDRTILADHAVIDMAPDNSIHDVHAMGNVRLISTTGMRLRSPAAVMKLGENNAVQSALFTGGVDFESETQGANGHSGEMLLHFVQAPASRVETKKKGANQRAESSKPSQPLRAGRAGVSSIEAAGKEAGRRAAHAVSAEKKSGGASLLKTIYASKGVTLRQAPKAASKDPQTLAMSSSAMTFNVNAGGLLTTAETDAAGELVMTSTAAKSAGEQTVIDAQHFTTEFGDENRLRTAHGAGAVKITSRTTGMPDKVSTSDTMVAEFAPGGEVSRVIQAGHFRYREEASSKNELGGRTSFADRATYAPAVDSVTLQGSPRIVDGGMTVTADTIRLLRHSGEAFAQGNVKSTYSELKLQPNGALLATADPIHVTSRAMNALQSSGLAHYTGGARLWQGSNIVEAQTIDFDQKARTIVALGDTRHPVNSVFLQVDKQGKASTMLVTAPRLTYADSEREARYSGGVTVRAQDGVMTADRADAFLNAVSATHTAGPSQLDHIIAYTHVLVQQKERRAEGEKLVYTAATGSFVINGGAPMLSDPVNGTVRGDSLTFYSHDDRVVVEGDSSSRAVTHTHVSR